MPLSIAPAEESPIRAAQVEPAQKSVRRRHRLARLSYSWRSRWGAAVRPASLFLLTTLASVTSAWAQEGEAAATESSKGGFATSLAYLLTIVVVALGVVVVCRANGGSSEDEDDNRDTEEHYPGQY